MEQPEEEKQSTDNQAEYSKKEDNIKKDNYVISKSKGHNFPQRTDYDFKAIEKAYIYKVNHIEQVYSNRLNKSDKKLGPLDGLSLREKEEIIRRRLQEGVIGDSNVTVSEVCRVYLDVKHNLAKSTANNYECYYKRYIKDSVLGKKKVVELKKSDILMYYKEKSDQGLANGTIAIIQKIIHPALDLAVDDRIIPRNPSNRCMKEYQCECEVKDALTVEEQKLLLEYLRDNSKTESYYHIFQVALLTAMRIGELLGLTWDDVNFKDNYIDINHQLVYRPDGKTELYLLPPKTKAGIRQIPMNNTLREIMIAQKRVWFSSYRDPKFEVDGKSIFCFISDKGRYMFNSNLNRALKKAKDAILDETKRDDIFENSISCHILRYTSATRLAESGMTPATLQYILGHSDPKRTMQIYVHAQKKQIRRELELADTLAL
ncbi:MAG: site-specific integrase [Anaerostipes sp.]|nr:site-specific integrase [Anaerostipes sp.]